MLTHLWGLILKEINPKKEEHYYHKEMNQKCIYNHEMLETSQLSSQESSRPIVLVRIQNTCQPEMEGNGMCLC
jgi:hypothetical protein